MTPLSVATTQSLPLGQKNATAYQEFDSQSGQDAPDYFIQPAQALLTSGVFFL